MNKLGDTTQLVIIACHARDKKKLQNKELFDLMNKEFNAAKALKHQRLMEWKEREREILMIQAAITPHAEAKLTQEQIVEHQLHDNFQQMKQVATDGINTWEDK